MGVKYNGDEVVRMVDREEKEEGIKEYGSRRECR